MTIDEAPWLMVIRVNKLAYKFLTVDLLVLSNGPVSRSGGLRYDFYSIFGGGCEDQVDAMIIVRCPLGTDVERA